MQPYYQQGGITLYHGDCRVVLPMLDAAAVDLVLTDPPYGTGGWRRHGAAQGSNPAGTLAREAWDDGAVDWLAVLPPVPVLTFWPLGRMLALLQAAVATGRTKHRGLYWRKPDPKPSVQGRARWSVEPIWVLSAEGFVLYGGDDWCEVTTPRAHRDREHAGHPYQKPLRLLCWLLNKTAATCILDPFAGVGSTLLAARHLGRAAIGIEQDECYCERTVQRLAQMPLALEVSACPNQ